MHTFLYLVLCDLFKSVDVKIVKAALKGIDIENLLKCGRQQDSKLPNNSFACKIEECGGRTSIKMLIQHELDEIKIKASTIMHDFFG